MIKRKYSNKNSNKIITILLIIIAMAVSFVPKAAYASEEESSSCNIAFTADVHGKTANLSSWISNLVSDGLTNPDYMVFGGDVENSFDAEAFSDIKSIVAAQYPLAGDIFVMGNHEWKGSGTESAFQEATGSTRLGVQAEGQNYIIYTLGASSTDQEFTEEDIAVLENYLSTASTTLPIFIVGHYPLHTYSYKGKTRETTNAKALIDLLNQYPNVIYLWGHNHTLKDTNYGTVKGVGDTIEYSSGNTKVINFTYANLGCMKDGAGQDAYGLLAAVENSQESWTVKLQYRNLSTTVGNATTISSLDNNTEAYANALLNLITVTPDKKTLYLGGSKGSTKKLTVTLPDAIQVVASINSTSVTKGGIEGIVSYSSGDSSIAAVSDAGTITAAGTGTTTINTTIVLANGLEKVISTNITVKKAYIKITSDTSSMSVGDTAAFTAKAYGYDTDDIVWNSNNSKIVRITQNGNATSVTKGATYIIASVGNITKKIKVTVK